MNVQNEQRQAEVHLETTDASLESNHPMEIETPNVVEATTTPADIIHKSASTSGLNLQSGSQHHFVTRSIANTSRLDVSHAIGVGATLVAMHNVFENVDQRAPCR